jgi:hypothetical protein
MLSSALFAGSTSSTPLPIQSSGSGPRLAHDAKVEYGQSAGDLTRPCLTGLK